jgi:hypothetical protein
MARSIAGNPDANGPATRPVKFRFDRVSVSSVLLTICLLTLMSWELKFAATWQIRHIWVTDRAARLNYEASIAFVSLALDIIVLIVIWTSFQKRMRWSWFAVAVFLSAYFVPVHLLDVLLDIKRVGWQWWPALVREAREGRPFALGAFKEFTIFALMVIALLAPAGDFFGKKRFWPSGANPNKDEWIIPSASGAHI